MTPPTTTNPRITHSNSDTEVLRRIDVWPPKSKGPKEPSIVFCNFNKFLKNNPETVRSWIRILREVPNSMLCLLENPQSGVVYMRKFIHEAAGTSNGDADEDSFSPGDGDDLNDRIHFLPWERNPFDHQQRNHDFLQCYARLLSLQWTHCGPRFFVWRSSDCDTE